MRESRAGFVQIGVDVGGTFTDVVCAGADGKVRLIKVPTTTDNPSVGVKDAFEKIVQQWGISASAVGRFVHGTTVATNAVIERHGAKTGLITTKGFRDVLELGRQMRSSMYDLVLRPETPTFLAPRALRKEVIERVDAHGNVLTPLDEDSVRVAVEELLAQGVEALSVCLLFSFLNPKHERKIEEIINAMAPGVPVSLSSSVDPAFREYERTCVTCFDAYIKPTVDEYLGNMERDLVESGIGSPLQVMQSRGGVASASVVRQRPVRLFLSGPAAGVVGGATTGRMAGKEDVITVDIGGTSCDVALIEGQKPLVRQTGVIEGYAVRVPMVDVNAIGSGGGSIAWIDGAGTLKVGPASAGSDPGPACYARGGTQPTVTDASVVLGYINPSYFAGGSIPLRPDLAYKAIEEGIARPLGMSVEQAATGIHQVINSQMAEAIRLVSIERGIDPRGFALLPLGGGGGLHATALADALGITSVVVPLYPGVLSALGLLSSPTEHEVSGASPMRLEANNREHIGRGLSELDEKCQQLMRDEGVELDETAVSYVADLCFTGQSHYLQVDLPDNVIFGNEAIDSVKEAFWTTHENIYGHADRQAPVEVVNLRVIRRWDKEVIRTYRAYSHAESKPAIKESRDILLQHDKGYVTASVFKRDQLVAEETVTGPAIVEQDDTTVLIGLGWRGKVLEGGSLILTAYGRADQRG